MSVNDFYIGFLNMDHRIDRLAHMTSQLERVGINAIRHRGKKPSEITDVPYEKIGVMLRRTEGAVPCHFGQVSIMREALLQGKHAWVMEDDLVFCEDFNDRLVYIFNWMDGHEWDIIWLGASFHIPPYWHCIGGSKDMRHNASAELGRDCETTDDPRMIRTWGAFATFAYLVNYNSIDRILKLLDDNLYKSIGIDWLMILLQPQLKCFSFVPGCVKQMDSQSDIGNGITRWSGFLQLNGTRENSAYVYQEKMTDFDPTRFQWL